GKHRDIQDATGSIPEIAREHRPQQPLVAGTIAALGGDVADLPADHRIVPARDGQVLHAVGGDQIRRDRAGEIRERTAGAARLHELAGDVVQHGNGRVLAAWVVAQVILLVALLHRPSTVLWMLYMVNRCHIAMCNAPRCPPAPSREVSHVAIESLQTLVVTGSCRGFRAWRRTGTGRRRSRAGSRLAGPRGPVAGWIGTG